MMSLNLNGLDEKASSPFKLTCNENFSFKGCKIQRKTFNKERQKPIYDMVHNYSMVSKIYYSNS